MRSKIQRIIFLIFFVLISLFIVFLSQCYEIFRIKNDTYVTYSDVDVINNEKMFGKFITASVDDRTVRVGNEKLTISKLVFKLFGFIPLREVNIQINEGETLYLGGVPLGFTIDIDGLLILNSIKIESESGNIDAFENSNLRIGDIITEINGEKVCSLDDILKIIEDEKYDGSPLKISFMRKNEKMITEFSPVKDVESKKYKLGLWVKNDASGVGTLTYVNQNTKKFGALGHPITDFDTGVVVPAKSGKVYQCSVVGLSKGEKGAPGEMKGVFMQGKSEKGFVSKNTKSGVFGEITDKDNIFDINQKAEVGGRLSVKPGKATLVSGITGVLENYDIEIIKVNYQPKSNDKSFVFRVTDERLLDLTGGIIQGMSGSPILQNGKIIGAVTHVFVSDPTKGYGIYIDWMLEQNK